MAKGRGSTTSDALKNCEKMAERCYADIYLMGHVHKLLKSDKVISFPDVRNMKIKKKYISILLQQEVHWIMMMAMQKKMVYNQECLVIQQ